jgi:transglutaminase-like putative cysteine protease
LSGVNAINNETNENILDVHDYSDNKRFINKTYYCNYSNRSIEDVAINFEPYRENKRDLATKLFIFVREKIIFGGDRWKVKASETLNKGYGACYNKNLLLIALLRYHGIPAKLCANPMPKHFNKAPMGFGYVTVSTPFYHCFTKLFIDGKWIDIDPTFDKRTYDTFFAPLGVDWDVEWDSYNDMLLYKGLPIGPPKIYDDIDEALNKNLNSHFLFRWEPEFLLSMWLSLGNSMMWKKTNKQPDR